jgi:hypothetical protein
VQEFRGWHLKLGDRRLNDLQGMRETELLGIDRRQTGGLVHGQTDGLMGNE